MIGQSMTGTRWFIDIESMSKNAPGIVAVWVRSVPEAAKTESTDSETTQDILKRIQERYFGEYAYTEGLWEVDCIETRYRLLYFCARNVQEDVISSTFSPDAAWSFVLNGSLGEVVCKAVCDE